MKRLLLALALLFCPSLAIGQGPPTGPPYLFPCNTSYFSNYSANTSTLVLSGSLAKGIYICGWHATTANSVAQTTFQLYQAITSQGVSQAITPQVAVNYTAPSADHIDYASLQTSLSFSGQTTSPNNLYIVTTGQGSLSILVFLGQY